jgi:hypothetical protein
MRNVAVSKLWSRGEFLRDSPANAARGIETTRQLNLAKWDFADQTAIDDYAEARGGTAGEWVLLDLTTAGVV